MDRLLSDLSLLPFSKFFSPTNRIALIALLAQGRGSGARVLRPDDVKVPPIVSLYRN
jgi:hypothetical protein